LITSHLASALCNFQIPTFGQVIDACVPKRVGRKSGRKYGFIRFKVRGDGKKAIQACEGKLIWGKGGCVNWAKFQKRPQKRKSKQQWIPNVAREDGNRSGEEEHDKDEEPVQKLDDSCQKLLRSEDDANFIETIGNHSNKEVPNAELQACSIPIVVEQFLSL